MAAPNLITPLDAAVRELRPQRAHTLRPAPTLLSRNRLLSVLWREAFCDIHKDGRGFVDGPLRDHRKTFKPTEGAKGRGSGLRLTCQRQVVLRRLIRVFWKHVVLEVKCGSGCFRDEGCDVAPAQGSSATG